VITNTAVPFDRVAGSYDQQWTNSSIGRAQRALVWRHIDPLFRPGDRILDVGCGTGADAAHFAERGVTVRAIDPSPGMIDVARRRAGFTAEVLRAEDIATIQETFHGATSNFGALNCVDDVEAVARGLAGLVRPGGPVAICTIGRFCAWETLYYAARLQLGKAFRRFRGSAPSSLGMTVHYPSVSELRAAFADFELERWMGIGLFVPPSYVRMPARLVRWCSALDRMLARVPLLRALADHRLLIFVRRPHAG
jgi:ubiquinone/menaquinone biosynthesis C-methylase UbiE